MQPQEINKIRELVKTSSLLSSSEKEEWLALTDLMNDKQLWELKSILTSSIQHVTTPIEKKQVIPPLTHIVNLPKAGTAVFPKQELGIRNQELGKEQKTRFWQKIKEVLAEKELPPGHKEPSKELELPEPLQAQSAKHKAQSEEEIQPRVLPKKSPMAPKPPLAPKLLLQRQGALSTANQIEQKPAKSKEEERGKDSLEERRAIDFGTELIRDLQKPEIRQPSEVMDEIGQMAARQRGASTSLKHSEDKLFVAGLKDAGILMGAKLREKPQEGEEIAEGGKQIKELQVAKINTLEQVSKLSVRDLTNNLAPPLKNLSGSLGYHKLTQALEKSPLFSIYINTGLAALSEKYDLTSGEYKTKSMERYLEKEEFEKFTDVLREIKK